MLIDDKCLFVYSCLSFVCWPIKVHRVSFEMDFDKIWFIYEKEQQSAQT